MEKKFKTPSQVDAFGIAEAEARRDQFFELVAQRLDKPLEDGMCSVRIPIAATPDDVWYIIALLRKSSWTAAFRRESADQDWLDIRPLQSPFPSDVPTPEGMSETVRSLEEPAAVQLLDRINAELRMNGNPEGVTMRLPDEASQDAYRLAKAALETKDGWHVWDGRDSEGRFVVISATPQQPLG